MPISGLNSFIKELEKQGELIRVKSFVNPDLEITEITDRISKQEDGGKAILFENTGTRFPLLINALGAEKRIAMAFGRNSIFDLEKEIEGLFADLLQPKENLWDKLKLLPKLKEVSQWMPRKLKRRGLCQDVCVLKPNLNELPILKCWPADGGKFITLPGVHTVDPETKAPNLGMYRMQVFEKNLCGMHWHKHKTGAAHFNKYKKLGEKMPVSVALGGDLIYTYAATAPMPENIDEYLLAGFLRKKPVKLVKCITNELYVPEDSDFVIEGYVDPSEELIWEGPFGDHTGFYSLADWYPKFHVTCITHKKNAIYPATIVGVPPMEDAYIGLATERIFLTPIRISMVPELKDMILPVAGVAHNFTVVNIEKSYSGQAIKVMHSLWGAGQMMFNKVLVVVDENVDIHDNNSLLKAFAENFDAGFSIHFSKGPMDVLDHSSQKFAFGSKLVVVDENVDIHDNNSLLKAFAENFDAGFSIHFSKGPMDVLDHSSQKFAFGSKLGIDLTKPFPEEIPNAKKIAFSPKKNSIEDIKKIAGIVGSRSLFDDFDLPVLLLNVKKDSGFSKQDLRNKLKQLNETSQFKVVFIFNEGADLTNYFTLIWLLGGNLEPMRDISILNFENEKSVVLVDATFKTDNHDNFERDWPNVVTMDDKTISEIDEKWNDLGLGGFIESPSLKFKTLVKGDGAVRK